MKDFEVKFLNYLESSKPQKRRPLWQLLIADILAVGVVLCSFSLFHHVIPQKGDTLGINLFRPNNNHSSGTASNGQTYTPDSTVGDFSSKFADKFTTDGSTVITDTSYIDDKININITTHKKDKITYYVADIYIKNIDCFRTALAEDTYGKGYDESIPEMAENNDAILAINGDYYGNSSRRGTVIRNGIFYRGNTYRHTCVLYRDGTMETYYEEEYDIDKVLEKGPWQAWSFGPMLLDKNSKAIPEFDTSIAAENPRTAIGYYEPGHYCFVTVDGRQEGYSEGITLPDFSELMEDLGCTAAYNLDGGQSAEMYYNGDNVNRPYKGGRDQSDIIYIGKEN